MMQIESKVLPYSFATCLLLGLQVTSSHGLHCFTCMRCTHINWDAPLDSSYYNMCLDGEVCSKDIMFYKFNIPNKTSVVIERVSRNCIKYDPARDILNDCVWKKGISPPYSGVRCLCNDKDYCNGTEFLIGLSKFQLLLISSVIRFLCSHFTDHIP